MRCFFAALALPATCFMYGAQAKDYHFEAALLDDAAKHADLSLFEQGLQQPGTYRMDILLNGELVDSRDISLRLVTAQDGHRRLQPCLSTALLKRWGVKTEALPGLTQHGANASCVRLAAIPQATITADVVALQLRLDIPQAVLQQHIGGLAPEVLWDDGITAFLLNYSAGMSREAGRADSEPEGWVQLLPGLNTGPWRIRSNWNLQRGGQWQQGYTWGERGLRKLKSRLSLGGRTTDGDIFDGVPFTGVMLATDEAMIPAGERSFAPAVSGVARTHATIEVRQNGYLLKAMQVAPGPFDIQDLPTGRGGSDLQVTVREADGHSRVFTVPWQTPAIALHAGYLKYSLAAGRYRPADRATQPAPLAQATAMYGLPYGLTAYGGVQAAAHYSGASLGVGSSLGCLGAASADATAARSQTADGERRQGLAWRMRYSNRLAATGTGFTLTSWQYDSSGYRSLAETLGTWQKQGSPAGPFAGPRLRARDTLSLTQSAGAAGSLSVSATRTNWRGAPGGGSSYSLNWSKSVYGASLSVNWEQSQIRAGCRDRSLSVWLSVPLGGGTSVSWNMTTPATGGQSHEAGLSGTGMDNRLAWDVRERLRTSVASDQRNSSSLHLGWSGAYGQANMGYDYSPSGRQESASVAGGMIVHRHGVTFSQPLSDTVTLVSAPGAAGVKVGGWPGVRTDGRGYTAAPGLTDYQENTVSLDPTTLPEDADVPQTDVKVVPTEGAVVVAAFRTRTGARALVTLRHPDGSPVAFGSHVDVEGESGSAGLADAGGQAYLTGLPARGTLHVQAGADSCLAAYRLPERKGPAGLYELSAVCRPATTH